MTKNPIDLKNRTTVTALSSGLSEENILDLQNLFKKYSNIHAAILYGSRAKGNFKKGSDIDLTLIGDKLSLDDLLNIKSEFQDLLLPYNMDLSIYHQIDNEALQDHIRRTGQIFYISSGFQL